MSSCCILEREQAVREGEVLADAGQAGEVAVEALARGGASLAFEVDVGDAGDGEAAGGEAELGAEAGRLDGCRRAQGRVGVDESADDSGRKSSPP